MSHLINGLMDARKEGAPVIAIAGDVETAIMDTDGLEELNPYLFFSAASSTPAASSTRSSCAPSPPPRSPRHWPSRARR
ncbi:hypothetical protein ACFQ9X_07725 [Catenulispora yoronensis]